MITKVFENYPYTEIQKVKKTIEENSTEVYYDTVTRTKRVYEPPTGVSHCLHTSCGVKLRSTMWKYSSSGKYLCPTCWYKRTTRAQREKYRQQAQKMSTGGFSYKNITDSVRKTRTIKKSREIEVEEPVTRNGIRIVFPEDIKYQPKNKQITHNLQSVCDILDRHDLVDDKISYFKDDILMNDSQWYNCSSYTKAVQKITAKRQSKHRESVEMLHLGPIPFNEVIVDEKQVLEEFVDIVGFYPNVPAFIQGHPLNMYNNQRKHIINTDQVVTIYCNLALESKADYGHYKNRGAIIYNFLKYLIDNDYKVNLILLDASFIKGETIIQQFEPIILRKIGLENPDVSELKEKQDVVMSNIYSLLTTLSFYRVLLLENKAQIIQNEKLNEKWFDGFGYIVKNNDLKALMKLDNEIIIGSPFEHEINGFFMDDDSSNLMDSIGVIKNLYIADNNGSNDLGEITSIKKLIEKRRITKLIHVTSNDNIDSIKEFGILPKAILEEEKKQFHQNDFQRLDNYTDAICLSISEPNNYLFAEYSKRNPNVKYQVLEIDPKILYVLKYRKKEIKKIYSDYNAASRYSQNSEDDMNIMFQDRIRRKAKIHTREGKDTYHPTSSQAEILFFGKIPSKYIMSIVEFDLENLKSRKEKGKTISAICREVGNITACKAHRILVSKGYLESKSVKSKTVFSPTKKGESIGISMQTRKSKKERYVVNVYNEKAENIVKILLK